MKKIKILFILFLLLFLVSCNEVSHSEKEDTDTEIEDTDTEKEDADKELVSVLYLKQTYNTSVGEVMSNYSYLILTHQWWSSSGSSEGGRTQNYKNMFIDIPRSKLKDEYITYEEFLSSYSNDSCFLKTTIKEDYVLESDLSNDYSRITLSFTMIDPIENEGYKLMGINVSRLNGVVIDRFDKDDIIEVFLNMYHGTSGNNEILFLDEKQYLYTNPMRPYTDYCISNKDNYLYEYDTFKVEKDTIITYFIYYLTFDIGEESTFFSYKHDHTYVYNNEQINNFKLEINDLINQK